MLLDAESRILLKDSASDWLSTEWPVSKFRALRDSEGVVNVADIWRGMTQLGWPELCLEGEGREPLGAAGMGIVLTEAGRNLATSPLLTTGLLAASALNLCKSNSFLAEIADRLATQGLIVSFAIDEGLHHDPYNITTTAVKNEEGWQLNGAKTFVPFTVSAEFYLVTARIEPEGTVGVFIVAADSLECSHCHQIDYVESGNLILNQISVSFETELIPRQDAADLLRMLLDRAAIGVSAEMLGVAESAFQMTVEYLKIREQFGQYIGAFHALQHRAAKMYTEIELCRSAVDHALAAVDNEQNDLSAIASMTKVMANETLRLVASEAIQLHGGIGMTDEHDAGLYIKRARVLEAMYGATNFHKKRYAAERGF